MSHAERIHRDIRHLAFAAALGVSLGVIGIAVTPRPSAAAKTACEPIYDSYGHVIGCQQFECSDGTLVHCCFEC